MSKEFHTYNPYTKSKLNSYPGFSTEKLEHTIQHAHETFLKFRHKKPSSRSEKMKRIARLLEKNKQQYAEMITNEMGKSITQSISEIEKCAWVCNYYAENAPDFLKAENIETDASKSYVSYEPLGVILGIMPWNYPFWQVFRVIAPNLMLGNSVIIKHSPNTLGCGELIQELIEEAGFEPYTVSHIIVDVDQVESIIDHNLIKVVTLTGSTKAGSIVAGQAGKAIKKSVLELGGNNALVVFDDADFEKTADICIKARFQNTGQSCIAGKRLLVQENVYDKFIELIKDKITSLKIGSPTEEETYISVLAREDLAENLKNQLNESLLMGASLSYGGKQKGCFFEPTLVENVTPDMPIFKEETFGPLLAVSKFKDDDEALKLINNSDYGLGVSLFTNDKEKISKLIPLIDDGAVFVNSLVKSDPRLPFGGTKNSGYGRELAKQGLLEFANHKTIYIQ
jgi:succinate-semialdehyde dehydrogenase/glutarate-semialdehyde dehydrogenase